MPQLDRSKPGLHVRYRPNDRDVRIRRDDLARAIAELQDREAQRDPQYRPQYDLRRQPSQPRR